MMENTVLSNIRGSEGDEEAGAQRTFHYEYLHNFGDQIEART